MNTLEANDKKGPGWLSWLSMKWCCGCFTAGAAPDVTVQMVVVCIGFPCASRLVRYPYPSLATIPISGVSKCMGIPQTMKQITKGAFGWVVSSRAPQVVAEQGDSPTRFGITKLAGAMRQYGLYHTAAFSVRCSGSSRSRFGRQPIKPCFLITVHPITHSAGADVHHLGNLCR
jgi:hypothetical protein